MGYSEQEENYMRLLETLFDHEYTLNKELRAENRKLIAENKALKAKQCPNDSQDYARIRKQAQELQKKYRQAQAIIEQLREENKKLNAEIKYRVKK